ncbi:MAG: universal stress protein [Betaproteobacteria bacterium]|nr:universal stress protein [Betaproteobacteria bacterium]
MAHSFERILLVTEHTEFDGGAERLAFDIARQCGIGLRAVFPVVQNLEYEISSPDLAQRSAREFAERVAQLRVAAQEAGIALDLVVRQCEAPHAAIVQEAREYRADLIIARRRGQRSFLSKLMIGEMVSKVAAEAPCSMLFVPRKAHLWSRAILAAIDLGVEAEPVAAMAATVAVSCRLPLTLMTVSEDDMALTRLEAIAAGLGVAAECVVVAGKPHEAILSMAETKHADLIVAGRYRSSTTKNIIGHTDHSVLVVKGDA